MCGLWLGTALPSWGLPIIGFLPLLFFCFITYGIYRLLRSPAHCQSVTVGSARDVLDKRYANGEITVEEYHRVKSDLS